MTCNSKKHYTGMRTRPWERSGGGEGWDGGEEDHG